VSGFGRSKHRQNVTTSLSQNRTFPLIVAPRSRQPSSARSIVAHVDLFNLRGPDDPPYVETDRNMSTVEQALALPKTGAGPLLAYGEPKFNV
jgi:hypothetical protein